MSDTSLQPAAAQVTTGLSQWQRIANTFSAPSKTFTDIKNGHRSWWGPFIIVLVTGLALWGTITSGKTQVTWNSIYETQQQNMPEFAKRMQDNAIDAMPKEQQQKARADMEKRGVLGQEITWLLSPGGLLLMNLLAALVLWPTINFGFGGKATFGSVFVVTVFATLVLWPVKLILGTVGIWAGTASVDLNNIAGTNYGYYMEQHTGALYAIATALDPLVFWNLTLTGMGLAIVAGVKRSSGYIAVFAWWALWMIVVIGFTAAFS